MEEHKIIPEITNNHSPIDRIKAQKKLADKITVTNLEVAYVTPKVCTTAAISNRSENRTKRTLFPYGLPVILISGVDFSRRLLLTSSQSLDPACGHLFGLSRTSRTDRFACVEFSSLCVYCIGDSDCEFFDLAAGTQLDCPAPHAYKKYLSRRNDHETDRRVLTSSVCLGESSSYIWT